MAKFNLSKHEDDPTLLALGRQIFSKRTKKGISQFRLALLCGSTQSYISDLELGRRNPSVVMLDKISRALDCTIADLFAEEKVK